MYWMCKCKLFTLHEIYMLYMWLLTFTCTTLVFTWGTTLGGCLNKDTRLTLAPT